MTYPPMGGSPDPNDPLRGPDPFANPSFPPPMSPVTPNYGAVPIYSTGTAVRYGWEKFTDNAWAWIAFIFIVLAVNVAISFLLPAGTSLADVGIGTVATIVTGLFTQAAMVGASLREVDGQRPGFGAFFRLPNIGVALVVAVVVSIIVTIGFVALVIPGVVLTYLTWYSVTFALDRGMGVGDSIKSGVALGRHNVGRLLPLALACVGLNLVGSLLCLIGLFVSLPVTAIAATYAYRALTGGYVSPVNAR